MMQFFWIFIVIMGTSALAIVFQLRQRYYLWGWNFLMAVLVSYCGLYQLTGTPRSTCMLSFMTNLRGSYNVVYHTEIPNKGIFLNIQPETGGEPIYIVLPWSPGMANAIRSAAMKADDTGNTLKVHAEFLSQCRASPAGGQDGQQGEDGQSLKADKGHSNQQKKGHDGVEDNGAELFYTDPVRTDPNKPPPPAPAIEIH